MNAEAYLRRIGYDGRLTPDIETLEALHLAHMYAVPFENLDIHLGVEIEVAIEKAFDKIVNQNRGGFCYELNGLFGWLLSELGFDVEMLSARVCGKDGQLGREFDHMLLRVNNEFIADVGFGDSFTRPMRFEKGVQAQETGKYRLNSGKEVWTLESESEGDWTPKYVFSEQCRALRDFAEMCVYQQTSADSIFTQRIICSKATPAGRVTYANGRFIKNDAKNKSEHEIENSDELRKILVETFGFELDSGYDKLLNGSGSIVK